MTKRNAWKHNLKHSWTGNNFTLSAQLPFGFSRIVCFLPIDSSLKGSQSPVRPSGECPLNQTSSADRFLVSSDLLSVQKPLLMYVFGRPDTSTVALLWEMSDSMQPHCWGNWCTSYFLAALFLTFFSSRNKSRRENTNAAASKKTV